MTTTTEAPAPLAYGHLVRIAYRGPTNHRPSRITASWEGWPSDGGRRVSKSVSRDYQSDRDDYAQWAARELAKWLEGGPMGAEHSATVERITLGSLDGATDIALIKIEWKPRAA